MHSLQVSLPHTCIYYKFNYLLILTTVLHKHACWPRPMRMVLTELMFVSLSDNTRFLKSMPSSYNSSCMAIYGTNLLSVLTP